MLQRCRLFMSRSRSTFVVAALACLVFSLTACAEKSFVGAPDGGAAQLGVVVGLADMQDGSVTGVRIEVSFTAGEVRTSLYDQVIAYTLDQPSRDFSIPLDIGPCLRAFTGEEGPPSACPVNVTIEIRSGTRVLARDELAQIDIAAGQTVTAPALGARTATALRLTRNGSAVPNPLPLSPGESVTITSEVLDAALSPIGGRVVTWSSNAQSIATVSPNGVINALSSGTATITASTGTGAALLTQTINLQVGPRPVTTLTLSPNPAGVNIGATQQLTVVARDNANNVVATPPLTWETSATGTATVSASGLVTGMAFGSATITARTATGVFGTAVVNVGAVATLTLTPNPSTIAVGGTRTFTVVARDGGGTIVPTPALTWETGAVTIATVSNQGVATGVGHGSTTITARMSPAIAGTATLNVVLPTRIYGQVRNAETNLVVAGAMVRVTRQGSSTPITVTSAANGDFAVNNLEAGTYTVEVLQSGLRTQIAENVVLVSTVGLESMRLDFYLPPTTSFARIGGVAGRVTRVDGTAIANATVTLSGGAQTNGVFRATTTGADGSYAFAGILLDDSNEQPINVFFVAAEAPGFGSSSISVPIPNNHVVANRNLTLTAAAPITTFFTDGFETTSGWTTSGLWNRSTLTGISNGAFPTYVSLAPGDNSNGALPAPASGSFAFWFGSPVSGGVERGNFLNQHFSGDAPKSGGESMTPHSGVLSSPAITTIPSNAARVTLRFDTWFEIESVNPNASGYDIMSVFVRVLPSGPTTLVRRLNPFEAVFEGGADIPYTSDGYNRAPVWRPVEIDLDAYKGQQIQLLFEFNTVDDLYNGFRGWIIDNVTVSDRQRASAGNFDLFRMPSLDTPPQRRRGR